MVDGKRCETLFDSKRKLKEHLSPAPHRALRVICPFCCDKENSFNRAGDLKTHVAKRHKDAALATNVPTDELLSENNCFWLSYNPAVYRYLVEPTDRNARASSRLRSLLLEWTRKIISTPAGPKVKRGRHDWVEGWDRPVTDFRFPDVLASSATMEYSPTSPSLFTLISVCLSSDDVSAILEDTTSFYRVHLNNTLLFDAKGITSLSRKMAVLKPCALPESPKFHSMQESSWWPSAVHLATTLGVEPSFVASVDQAQKDFREPEIKLFAESDLEISPASSLESRRKVVEETPPRDPEPVRKRLRLGGRKSSPVYSGTSMHPEPSTLPLCHPRSHPNHQ